VELARRYVSGDSVDDIAAAFGCSPQAVKTRCNTLGIIRRKVRANRPENGNAGFLIGDALRSAIPIAPEGFADDLLARLDTALQSDK